MLDKTDQTNPVTEVVQAEVAEVGAAAKAELLLLETLAAMLDHLD
jgi:hypothetical protein